MGGGLAGTLMTGTAYAGPIIFTSTTSITGSTQAAPAWNGADPVVTVNVSVTAGGGSNAPTGYVTVTAGGQVDVCNAKLTSSSGLTASGSCELRSLAPGSYNLEATYPGGSQLAKSADTRYPLTVTRSTGQNATVTTALACPAAVNAGQSGNCKLTVTNKGPGTATNVDAKIYLPSALKARYCGNVWWNQGCSVKNNTASWKLGNLRAWQSRSLSVHFTAAGNRWYRHSSLVTVTGSATWGVNFQGQGPMQHVSISKHRVEIRPWGFVF
jgi:hypothetical protein